MTRLILALTLIAPLARAEAIISGKLTHPRFPAATESIPMSAILVFASSSDKDRQPIAFRTWETQPAGWYRIAGPPGEYTILFSTPAHFMRPIIAPAIALKDGEKLSRDFSPTFDYACFDESAWDKAASEYIQPFTSRGTSITQVGFKLAHDGVDGGGPASQTFLVSIHRKTDDPPEKWPQVGPTMSVVNVDCGGPKNYHFSCGWHSNQVPTNPGDTYAVKLRTEKGGKFQPFVHKTDDATNQAHRDAARAPFQLWLAVSSDADDLLIPLNKRVHHQFTQLTKFSKSWTQTYTAQGKSLAGIILYAATSGVQPSMNVQRLALRVREGGPDGKIIGPVKLAIGNGNFTGDASWGTFGLAYAPGELALKPKETYALEFESIETPETIGNYVNIKGMKSDAKPGFNPYRRHPLDEYEDGEAYLNGEKQPFDLDVQVLEYAR